MRLTKQQREELKQKYGGRCAYCGDELGKRWHADHMDPVYRVRGKAHFTHRDTLENLAPACAPCNLYKSVYTVEQFRRNIAETVRIVASQTCYRFAHKYGLVQETGVKVEFYFERMGIPDERPSP